MMKRILTLLIALMFAGASLGTGWPVAPDDHGWGDRADHLCRSVVRGGNATGGQLASELTRLVAQNLSGTGLFREVPASAFISQVNPLRSRSPLPIGAR